MKNRGGRPKKFTVPIKLTPSQKIVHASTARHRIVKAGRRFGKTFYAAYWLLKNALERPGRHWLCAKTSGLAVDEAWSRWQSWLPDEVVVGQDKRRNRIFLQVGQMRSELGCVSAEKEDNLRGRGLASLVLDEASFVTGSLYDTILSPMLLDHSAPSLVISSPKTGWFTRSWEMANKGELEDWEAFHFTIWDNAKSRGGIIADKEITAMEKRTPKHIWDSEFMAEESDGTGVVYSNFTDANVYDPKERFQDVKKWPCVVGIDWGKRDDTGILWLSISPEGYIVISEEHSKNGWEVAKHVGVMTRISRDFERLTPQDYSLSHDAFRSHNDSRDSIAEDFKRNGIHAKRSTRDLVATINKMRSFVSGNNGVPWLYVSSKCLKTIQAFQSWEWRDHEPDILQGGRYAIEEICRRRMTPFANMVANNVHASGSKYQFDSPVPQGQMTLERPKKRKQSTWGWDSDYGVPL